MSKAKQHWVVIGAGIVGSSCAWELVTRGFEVTLADPVLPGQSTSFGNAACISPSAVIPYTYPGIIWRVPRWLLDPKGPLFIQWSHLPALAPWLWRYWRTGSTAHVEAIAEAQGRLMASVTADYDRILRETRSEWLREKRGLIMLYDSEKAYLRDQWQFELRERLGQTLRRLEPGELTELEPALSVDRCVAVYDPVWQHLLDPAEVTRNIAEFAFEHGAAWKQDRVVTIEHQADGVRLQFESGAPVDADGVVIAAGVWSKSLLEPLGLSMPLVAKRGYHTMVHNPTANLSHPVMSVSGTFVMTPLRMGLRIAGTAEFAAVDAPPNYRRAKVLLEKARKFLPGLEGESYSEWMGQRPLLPDGKPAIGRVPGRDNILCAVGHGHYGITQGPTSARIIGDLASGLQPHVDLAPFAVDRF